MRIEYHRTLIADHVRNGVIYEALKAVIEPGRSAVADIGAGTGLLGLMAARLGAREVFLYEAAEVAGVAEEVVAASGFANCFVIPCHSTEMVDPPQVDVIISETLGNYAFEEDIISTVNDARNRFLKPGGRILPREVVQYTVPVVSPRIDAELRVWSKTSEIYGLDLSLPEKMSLNNVYVRRLAVCELLSGATREWDRANLEAAVDPSRSGVADWEIPSAATVHGFAVWWKADFGEGLELSTGPDAPETHWEQLYFPLEDALHLEPGMRLHLAIQSHSAPESGTNLNWRAECRTATGETISRQEMDLDKGYLP
jgi:Arginine methyltransferase oligomerization subdomain/Ribosomal protein L11 methyltransferase (PrmA)